MIITNIRDQDIDTIKRLHDYSFPFPNFEDSIVKRAVIDNGIIMGAGISRLTTEGILIIDKDLPVVTRVRAIKGLIDNMIPNVINIGINECHVFVKDPKMSNLLRGLGFQDCKGGQPMIVHF